MIIRKSRKEILTFRTCGDCHLLLCPGFPFPPRSFYGGPAASKIAIFLGHTTYEKKACLSVYRILINEMSPKPRIKFISSPELDNTVDTGKTIIFTAEEPISFLNRRIGKNLKMVMVHCITFCRFTRNCKNELCSTYFFPCMGLHLPSNTFLYYRHC
jgi:hypothetical protein